MAKRSSIAASGSARSFELCRVISRWLRFRCRIHQAGRPDQPKAPSADTREHPLGRPSHHSPACRVRLRRTPDKREPGRAVFHYVKIYPVCGDDVTFHRERSFCALLESLKRCARFNALAPPYYAGNEIQAEKKASDSAMSRLINSVDSAQRQRPALWPAHTLTVS